MEDAAGALGRGDWKAARELYKAALDECETPDALEGLGIASWWEDEIDAAIEARERAYELRSKRRETPEAARLAGFLAWDYSVLRGKQAVANGWLQRARRLAEELEPSAEHAWLPLIEASFHLDTNAQAVLELSTQAAEQARAFGGLDIEMTARTLQGLALTSLGRVEQGIRLLDEGTAAATAGELHDPISIGACCCNMIIACERSRDYDRAGQWCERLEAFCERTGQRPLLALCRAHHGTVLTIRGNWGTAERELDWASGELSTLRPALAGYAQARFADLKRRQGRVAEAHELLDMAEDHVLVPLVNATLALDEDDPAAAAAHAARYLDRYDGARPVEAAAGLELLIHARAALGYRDTAREAHEELRSIASAVGSKHARAGERACAAAISAADGEWDGASLALHEAVDLYRSSPAPFDAARAQIELAGVLDALGHPDRALEHALAACAVFEELGAERDAIRAGKIVAALGGRSAALSRAGLTVREVEVVRCVAEGLSNRQIAERLVVSEHTVHRHLANVYTKLGVSSRAAAAALVTQRQLLD